MLNLVSLKEARAAKTDAIRAIVAKAAAENRDLDEKEAQAFDIGKAEVERLERDLARAEFLADMERRMDGEPVGNVDGRFEVECRSYSLLRAIAAQVPNMNVDAGREREISRELERRGGRSAQGLLAPMSVFQKRAGDVITTTTPSAGPGSNLVATNLLAGEYIDILRDAIAVRRLGARVLSNLVGNVDISRLKQSATGEWVAENSALTASDMQFDKVQLTPKHTGSIIEMSRNMLQQTSPDLESLARDDMASVLARGIDRVAIQGGGANEPSGILDNADKVNDLSAETGAALTYADVVALIGAVEGSNALQGSLGFLTNSKVTTLAATTLKNSADTASSFIIPDPGSNTLAGYPLAKSNLVPSTLGGTVSPPAAGTLSAIIFGNWSDLLIGYWSAFDLLVNPFETAAYSKGNVLVRAMATADVAIRQPKSFAIMTSLDTSTGA